MRAPQLVICEPNGGLGRFLGDIATENRWLLRTARSVDNALSLLGDRRPAMLIVQVELGDDKPGTLTLISDANRLYPDVPIVAMSDAKLNDADRVAWTAVLFDLGTRYAMFPPLTRPVLEDVLSGLMGAAIRRASSEKPSKSEESVVDLSNEDVDE